MVAVHEYTHESISIVKTESWDVTGAVMLVHFEVTNDGADDITDLTLVWEFDPDQDQDLAPLDVLNIIYLVAQRHLMECSIEYGEVVLTSVQYADALEIEVADSGDGLSMHAKAWLFEPGFTTKPAGTGVGLAAARVLIEELGGGIEAVNCPEGGSAFTIRLPMPQTQKLAA